MPTVRQRVPATWDQHGTMLNSSWVAFEARFTLLSPLRPQEGPLRAYEALLGQPALTEASWHLKGRNEAFERLSRLCSRRWSIDTICNMQVTVI